MNGLTIITVLVVVGSAEAKRVIAGQKMNSSPVIGGFILGIFLFALTLANTQLAAKMCYFLIVAALVWNGTELAKALNPKPATKTAKVVSV